MLSYTTIIACVAALLDSYDIDVLLAYASDDDGAYTIYGAGFDYSLGHISAALDVIRYMDANIVTL